VSLDTVQAALQQISQRLAGVSETASLDAQVLLAHSLGCSRSWLLAHPETRLTDGQKDHLMEKVIQLEGGKPLPYVLGQWEFFGLSFIVTPDVLIPRPETELLVEKAIAWLKKRIPDTSRVIPHQLVLDAGTGSGCIAITLAKHFPDLTVHAIDISMPALRIAQKNARLHEVSDRLMLTCADLLPPVRAQFDLMCANLPYVSQEILPDLPVSRYEPDQALNGGPGGLRIIQRFLETCQEFLHPGGLLLMEIEASQGSQAGGLARLAFPAANISVQRDLSGCDRLLVVRTF
jgi:release factor glutamine methyltransferase